jgi:aryl-alcohol dehydrogenase-like predicted oxidoreductase
MELRKLGATGLNVSSLCLGAGMFGNREIGCDEQTSSAILDAYMDAGGNFVDSADFYGDGTVETVVGAITQGRRDRLLLTSKVGLWHGPGANARGLSRKHILDAIDESLRRLRTDYLDLYQVHSVDPWTPLDETLRALDDCVRSGRVRYLGCSNFEAWRLMKSLGMAGQGGLSRFVSIQLQYSLVSRTIEREHVPLCLEEGVGLLPYGVLAAGLLSGKMRRGHAPPAGTRLDKDASYRDRVDERALGIVDVLLEAARALGCTASQAALAWIAKRPAVASVILGVRSVEQIEDNLGAARVVIDPENDRRLDEASAQAADHPYDMIKRLEAFVAPQNLVTRR